MRLNRILYDSGFFESLRAELATTGDDKKLDIVIVCPPTVKTGLRAHAMKVADQKFDEAHKETEISVEVCAGETPALLCSPPSSSRIVRAVDLFSRVVALVRSLDAAVSTGMRQCSVGGSRSEAAQGLLSAQSVSGCICTTIRAGYHRSSIEKTREVVKRDKLGF